MKRLLTKFLIVVLMAIAVIGCASKKVVEPVKIDALKKHKVSKANTIRLENIKKIARGMGAQASLAKRSYQLNTFLESQRRTLDHIFNFNYLMLNKNVIPPILVEGRNTLNLADNFTIRVSDHVYQIVQPPRFVTVPPNWRNYLWMRYKEPEKPNATLLPQNELERKAWNRYIDIGWKEGVTQADQIFSANLARLKRDYEGMILYRKLLAQKMVSPPYVSKADLGVTGDGEKIQINDRVLRITSISQLQPNSKDWRPVISKKKQKSVICPKKTKKGKLKGHGSTRIFFSK